MAALLAQAQRWPSQGKIAGAMFCAARLAGAGAAAPTITEATNGDDGGIVRSVTRGGVGVYAVMLNANPRANTLGIPKIRVSPGLVDNGASGGIAGWTVVTELAGYDGTTGLAQFGVLVFDETFSAADLPTDAFADLLIYLDCGVI